MHPLFEHTDIILASRSPRRRQLLEGMGLTFRVVVTETSEEVPPGLSVPLAARQLAEEKARAVPAGLIHDNTLIIAADTLVVVDRLILGKPSGSEEARGMLQLLSGKEHEVVTGVCLREKSRLHSFSVSSRVRFKPLPEEEIEYYIKACQPYDKAGAYGIQEWIGYTGVEHIEGSFFNVMGLPTYRLWEEMKRFVSLKGEPG